MVLLVFVIDHQYGVLLHIILSFRWQIKFSLTLLLIDNVFFLCSDVFVHSILKCILTEGSIVYVKNVCTLHSNAKYNVKKKKRNNKYNNVIYNRRSAISSLSCFFFFLRRTRPMRVYGSTIYSVSIRSIFFYLIPNTRFTGRFENNEVFIWQPYNDIVFIQTYTRFQHGIFFD